MPESSHDVPSEYESQRPVRSALPKIVWVIPVAAVVITAVTTIRAIYGPLWWQAEAATAMATPAPVLELRDQSSNIVRISRYFGRQRLVVVFFDGARGPENSQQLLTLRDAFPKIQAAKAEVVAVSVATPYRNRQGIEQVGPFPFPLLSDVDYAVQKRWGVIDDDVNNLEQAVFLVDRGGLIRWTNENRVGCVNADTILRELSKIP